MLAAHRRGEIPEAESVRIGRALVFGRLWEELGIGEVVEKRLARRVFQFAVEQAVFLTVLHRLFASGSDRAAEHWSNSGSRATVSPSGSAPASWGMPARLSRPPAWRRAPPSAKEKEFTFRTVQDELEPPVNLI